MQAVLLALEARNKDREMTSRLLSALYPKTLSKDQFAFGFTRLLASAEVQLPCGVSSFQA